MSGIVFLTGSAESGRDGVGDYTRRLAQACRDLGAPSRILAIADHAVRQIEHVETPLPLTRFPAALAWSKRLRLCGEALSDWMPDWLSLQFVPYSFHPRGLAFRFVSALPRLARERHLAVMFHEIWSDGDRSCQARLAGRGQRWCVRRVASIADRLHTSNRTYQRLLADESIDAEILPLFGSVPCDVFESPDAVATLVARAGGPELKPRGEWWLVVQFGTLHSNWPAEPLFSRLLDAAAVHGKRVAVVSIGRLGAGARLWNDLADRYRGRLTLVRLGEQPEAHLAHVLRAADFGLATSPYSLIDKSASVAAMLEHGLPVIVNREDGPRPEAPLEPERLIRLDEHFEDRLTHLSRRLPASRLGAVTRQFLAALGQTPGAASTTAADVGA